MPTPEPDSGVEEDAETPDATGNDAAMHDAGAGDAAADHAVIDGAVDAAGDATSAADATAQDAATEDATADATTQDAATEDATADATTQDAATEDAATEDAGDATTADAEGDAPEGDATVDAGSNDAAVTGDASVVITGGSGDTPFPQATCVTAANSQTLTLSNPGDTPIPWTASETDSFFGGFPLAMLVPSSGTVAPGQSTTVNVVFSLVAEPLQTQSIQIQIASGGSTTTFNYLEAIAGYIVSAPATVDFGDVPSFADFNADAMETVGIGATGVDSFGNTNFPSPCVIFNTAQSGSSFFSFAVGGACGAAFGGGANVTFEFNTPIGTPPGIYQATYTFVASSFTGPPCNSPPPIQLRANLLPVQGSGP
jgi:hypothetical protein